jgi:uncharacterized hydrophobic protein (TIGR00271 family)
LGYVLMVLASAALATGGLLLNNTAVVIGSMCIAPFLGPSRAVCIGGLFRDRRVFLGGLVKQLFGLLIVGGGNAYLVATIMRAISPGVGITPEVLLRTIPTAQHAILSVVIAVSAGIAASLSLSADPRVVETPWGQVIDAVIGVEIAISLIPPASVVGIGLAFGRPGISHNAFALLMINVLGLDVLGSMLMLALRGVRAQYLVLEKAIRSAAEFTLTSMPGVTPVGASINVTLLSHNLARIHTTIRSRSDGGIPPALAESIATHVLEKTGCRSEVMVEMIPRQTYSML